MNAGVPVIDPAEARRFWLALKDTGALKPYPLGAIWRLWRAVRRYGPSFYALLAWQAQRQPQALALVEGEHQCTYFDLQRQADDWAARLPVQPGQRVGVICREQAAFVRLLLACARVGVRILPISPHLTPAQVADLCRVQEVALLVCDPDIFSTLESMPTAVLSTRELAKYPSQLRATRPRQARVEVMTSGTTGTPKVIRKPLVQPHMLRLGAHLLTTLKFQAGSSVLLTLPLYHGHGLTTLGLTLALGGTLHLAHGLDAGRLWSVLRERHIEVLVLVPTILHRLMQCPEPVPPTLRTVISGSGPLSGDLSRQALAHFGPVVFNLYGTTEMGLMTLATPHDLQQSPGTVGRALPGVYLDMPFPADLDRVGEVLYSNADQYREHQQLSTGDLGYFDDLGLLHLLGRTDDLIIRGGLNIDPVTVESELMNCGLLRECAVIGRPEAEYGQDFHAFVVLNPGASIAEVQQYVSMFIPHPLQPKTISVLPELPRNAVGKLMRQALRAALG